MNMFSEGNFEEIGSLLRVLGHPVRLQILGEIGTGEACVCHLEAQLGIRQAALSQHLMALREANILQTNREGRFIYYRVTDLGILDMVASAGKLKGIPINDINSPEKSCSCPKCCDKS